jgi:hypothetical protein
VVVYACACYLLYGQDAVEPTDPGYPFRYAGDGADIYIKICLEVATKYLVLSFAFSVHFVTLFLFAVHFFF